MAHSQHHYVPKFLLKQWHTPPDNKLSQYHWRGAQLIHERYTAKSVAKEAHLYSRMRDTERPAVEIERDFLGPLVDDPAAVAHRAIVAGGVHTLSDDQKRAWARFLISLLLRLPDRIADMRARGRAYLQASVTGDPDEYEAIRGDAPEATLMDWVRAHRPWEFDDLGIRTLPHLVDSEKMNTAFLNCIWANRTVNAPEDLLLGDRPLLYVGKLDACFLFILPLTPNRLYFAFDNQQTWKNIRALDDRNVVREVNRATVRAAAQYVYSTGTRHERLVRKCLRKGRTTAA